MKTIVSAGIASDVIALHVIALNLIASTGMPSSLRCCRCCRSPLD